MAELAVKEITELKDVEFTDDALLLGYTENDGVGKTTFEKAKELIGSDITLEQTKTASESSGVNEITATVRNGKNTATKKISVRNGTGLKSVSKSESTDANGLRSNNVTFNSSDTELMPDVSIDIKDGVGVKSHSVTENTDDNGLRSNKVDVTFTDETSDSFTVNDGVGIKSAEQITSSTLSGELNEYAINLTDGSTSKIQVYNGRAGKDFHIAKTYSSITEMENDFSGADVGTFEFAMIDTGSVEDEDTGKLYCKGTESWSYIGDLSGKQGIKGETGNGIKSASTTYQLSTSGTAIPTGDWSSTPLAPTETQYLWTKTVITFTDNTTHTFYSVGGKSLAGATGTAAGFGTPTASVDANIGTPSVTVTASGANTAKVFNFAFKNLKGEKGADGANGTTPTIKVANGSNIATVGTPSVTASTSGTETTFTFNYLKGAKGEKGDAGVWDGKVPTSKPSTLENGMIWIA